MKQTTIVFCIKEDKVLFGKGKGEFGGGKWNGFGGKLEQGETFLSAAVRELQEESGLVTKEGDLVFVAKIQFFFDKTHMFDCQVYTTKKWVGEPVETAAMIPKWFSIKQLPFDDMWPADVRWVPSILRGKKIEGTVVFDEGGKKLLEFKSQTMSQ